MAPATDIRQMGRPHHGSATPAAKRPRRRSMPSPRWWRRSAPSWPASTRARAAARPSSSRSARRSPSRAKRWCASAKRSTRSVRANCSRRPRRRMTTSKEASMAVYRGYVFCCDRRRCKSKPHVVYEQFIRTDLRSAERMARQDGWVKVGDEWFCSAEHAAAPYLERKRARSAKRVPRAQETLAEVAADTAHVTEETLAAVAADGRDG